MLVARHEEKAVLQRTLSSEYSSFVAVYGRRRIGKTFLIRESFDYKFTFEHAGIYEGTRREQLAAFAQSLEHAGYSCNGTPGNWMEAFEMLRKLICQSDAPKKIVFLDELSWMDTPHSDLMKALEFFWNSWASARKDVVFVVCASATSWMLNHVIHNKGGLYNRLTAKIRLLPFSLAECEEYLESQNIKMSRHQIIEGYMVLGGVPYYWSKIDKSKSLPQNIDAMFFAENPILENEFEYLFSSVFRTPEPYIKIISALGRKKPGLLRDELLKATGITDSGNFSRMLTELENCGFIRHYDEYGKKVRGKKYQLIDNFTLFYYKFLEKKPSDEHFWTNQTNTSARNAWCGLAFERVCMEHIPAIKQKLGISGVLTEVHAWSCKKDSENGLFGSQIDLLIVRRDQVINLCEMKYAASQYTITKKIDENVRNKISDFLTATHTKYAIHVTFVTPYGITQNEYAGNVQSEITADDLFAR